MRRCFYYQNVKQTKRAKIKKFEIFLKHFDNSSLDMLNHITICNHLAS